LTGERDSGYSREDMIKKHVEESQSNSAGYFPGIQDAQSNYSPESPFSSAGVQPTQTGISDAQSNYNQIGRTVVV